MADCWNRAFPTARSARDAVTIVVVMLYRPLQILIQKVKCDIGAELLLESKLTATPCSEHVQQNPAGYPHHRIEAHLLSMVPTLQEQLEKAKTSALASNV